MFMTKNMKIPHKKIYWDVYLRISLMVSIGRGNGLLPSGNKPLSQSRLTLICTTKPHWNESLCHPHIYYQTSNQWGTITDRTYGWPNHCLFINLYYLLQRHHFNQWKFHDDTMMGTLSKMCERQTDGRMDRQMDWCWKSVMGITISWWDPLLLKHPDCYGTGLSIIVFT